MEKDWIEVELCVPGELVDLAVDLLTELGSQGVVVSDQVLDTFVIPEDTGYEVSERLKAYFEMPQDPEEFKRCIETRLEQLLRGAPDFAFAPIRLNPVGAQDWAEGWKQHFTPFRVGSRLWVTPTWEHPDISSREVLVRIDPGMAFGTGSHETTRLCLEEVVRLFENGEVPGAVLDVGTGSGILAIAAAALGSSRVIGCEIDELACEVARENVALNGRGDRVEVTSAPLESLEGRFDLVIANILAEENVRLASELVEHTAVGGRLVLSGILKEKESFVLDGFRKFPLSEPNIAYQNEWVCVGYRRLA